MIQQNSLSTFEYSFYPTVPSIGCTTWFVQFSGSHFAKPKSETCMTPIKHIYEGRSEFGLIRAKGGKKGLGKDLYYWLKVITEENVGSFDVTVNDPPATCMMEVSQSLGHPDSYFIPHIPL